MNADGLAEVQACKIGVEYGSKHFIGNCRGIIAIGAIVGFAKGAVRIAVSLGATILTLVVVYFATPYVSKAILFPYTD